MSSSSFGRPPDPAETSTTGSDPRLSIGELFSEVSEDLTTLIRQEVELAKAELHQSASRAGKGAGMIGGAGLAGYMVLLFVSIAAWWGLGDAIGRGWSALVVAVVWLIIAAVLAQTGRKALKTVPGVPQTADTVKQIPNAIKGNEETS